MAIAKILPLTGLVAVGAVLGYIAYRTPEPDYTPPAARQVQAQESAVPTALSGEVPDGMLVRTFDVEGMCCSGCTAKLHAALVALPDVNEAAVSFEAGQAQAVVPETTDAALLVEALNFDKYTASLRP